MPNPWEQYQTKPAAVADKMPWETFKTETKEEPTLGEQSLGFAENIGAMASGILAEPIAGLGGIATGLGVGAANILGLTDQEGSEAAADFVKQAKGALTYTPGSEVGKEYQKNVGEFMAPVGKVLSGAEKFLGENVLEVTGSPALASIAHTLPTAALELLGVKGSKAFRSPKKPSQRQISKAVIESAPEIESIKNASRAIYNEIDTSGVTVKSSVVDNLINKIESDAKKAGLDPRLTDKTARAMDIIKESKGVNQPLTELDALREIASRTTKSLDDTEKAIGNLMLSEIDNFMDNIRPVDLVGGTKSKADVGKKYKQARKLWGRARRAEMIDEAIVTGTRRASGAEAGIRNEFNTILNSKRKSKYIPADEKKIMQDVVEGDFKRNLTRLIGKTGFSIDRSPNVFQGMISSGLGYGAFGSTGALVVPAVGTVAKKIAQNLTVKKAEFTKKVMLAGKDSNAITRAYLQSVPKAKRNTQDLADLLSDPNINIDEITMVGDKMLQDAIELAKGQRAIDLAVGALAGASSQTGREQQPSR